MTKTFTSYTESFMSQYTSDPNSTDCNIRPGIADTRSGLLEFSQYRNFQFDTIRRAKYSTAMLLYYLQNPVSSGIVPSCTSCEKNIVSVRWRRINKAFDERRRGSLSPSVRFTSVPMDREDLCSECYSSKTSRKEDFFLSAFLLSRQL